MTNSNLVSIIVPMYNAREYISEALESLIKQSYKNIEIIVVDDGSTDNSSEIAKNFSTKDKRIKLIENAQNAGVAAAKNRGIKEAAGEYIAYSGADDISHIKRVEWQVDYLIANPKIEICGGHTIIIDNKSNPIGYRKYPLRHNSIMRNLILNNAFADPSIMIRREVYNKIGFNNTDYKVCSDYEFFLRAADVGIKMGNLDKFLVKYRVSNTQFKFTKTKESIKNTVILQKNYLQKKRAYSLIHRTRHILLKLLLLLPPAITVYLFKLISYKKDKNVLQYWT